MEPVEGVDLAIGGGWAAVRCWTEANSFSAASDASVATSSAGHGSEPQQQRKRPRVVAVAVAKSECYEKIAAAANGHVGCSCATNCCEKIAKNVSAPTLNHILTWRHRADAGTERDVSAAFIRELRGCILPDGDIYCRVDTVECCTRAHAYFNDCWSTSEGREGRTYRRYVTSAKNGSAAEAAASADASTSTTVCNQEKILHASNWIVHRIVHELGQTFPVMQSGGNDAPVVAGADGSIDVADWEYRIRTPSYLDEFELYDAEANAAGTVYRAKYTLFRRCWDVVTTKTLNVSIDSFNGVTKDCFECVYYQNLQQKYRIGGGVTSADRAAAKKAKEHHNQVIRFGHRAGYSEFARQARNADSEMCAIDFDVSARPLLHNVIQSRCSELMIDVPAPQGVDNSYTHAPSLDARYNCNKQAKSLPVIPWKTTGFVEFGKGLHFEHAQPWLACHSSMNLNFTCIWKTMGRMLEADTLRPACFWNCDGGDANWADQACIMAAAFVQVDMFESLIVHRHPVAHTHGYGDALW